LLAAASNWHVLARFAGQYAKKGCGLLIDIGSTTCDIIPLVDGQPVTLGRTDPTRLARWYGHVEGELRPGGRFRTYLEGPDIEGTGRVDACEPPRRLQVTTRETDESYQRGQGVPPHDTGIEVTLTAVGDQTDLTIQVRGMPLDKIAFYGAGWQIHAENLAGYLAGKQSEDEAARWAELVQPYELLAAPLT